MKILTPVSLLMLLAATAASAQTAIDQTHPLGADAEVQINNLAGSVTVRGSERSDLRITGTLGKGTEGLTVEGDSQRLQIEVDYPNSSGWGGWWGGGRVTDSELIIELPRGAQLEVETVSASIRVTGMSGSRVELESVSGQIDFDGSPQSLEVGAVSGEVNVKADGITELSLESVSGSITLTGAVTDKIRAESVSGRLRLEPDGAMSDLQASVVSGDIDLRATLAPGGRISAESLSGNLQVRLPRSTSARLDASSFSGSIRSDAGTVEKEEFGPGSSLKARLGDGDGQIRLESFSGKLQLTLE